MLAAAVDSVGTGMRPITSMRPPTSGKPSLREIDHARRLRDAAVEPRLDRVAVGRGDVDRLRRHQRAHVAGDHHVGGAAAAGCADARTSQVEPLPTNSASATEAASARQRRTAPAPARPTALRSANEVGGGGFARQSLAISAPQRLDRVALGGKRRIGGNPPLDSSAWRDRARRRDRREPAGSDRPLAVGGASWLVLSKLAISRRRARASRDITVPIGTSVTCAISR